MSQRITRRTVAFSVALALAPSAGAFQFKTDGDLAGSFDTTVSVGGLWRVQARDPGRIAIVNGGTARSPNEDDGNLYWDKGSAVSSLVKMVNELDLKYGNFGLFGRVLSFYDAAIDRKEG